MAGYSGLILLADSLHLLFKMLLGNSESLGVWMSVCSKKTAQVCQRFLEGRI